MENDHALIYRQSAARGASPIGLVVMLYDTIINDLRRGMQAMREKNIEVRSFELGHAITVIGHLQSTLDREQGGEVARCLDRFYNVTRGKILEAAITQSEEILRQLLEQFLIVRDGWQQVEPQTAAPSDSTKLEQADVPVPMPHANDTEAVASHWSA